jgi:hypothetical protein
MPPQKREGGAVVGTAYRSLPSLHKCRVVPPGQLQQNGPNARQGALGPSLGERRGPPLRHSDSSGSHPTPRHSPVLLTIGNSSRRGEILCRSYRFRAYTHRMAQWNENLRCVKCRSTGIVCLSQGDGDYAPAVYSISGSFKVVQTQYGPDFHCGVCNVAAEA